MVPPRTDPKWKHFSENIGNFPVKNLATRMLMNRLKLLTADRSEVKSAAAIVAAYDFFSKNEAQVQDDIKLILG